MTPAKRLSVVSVALAGLLAGFVAVVAFDAPRQGVARGRAFNRRAIPAFMLRGSEAERGEKNGKAFSIEDYDNRAFPATDIAVARQQAAFAAFLSMARLPGGKSNNWQEVGPLSPYVVDAATYTGRPTFTSGRVTALALAPECKSGNCRIFVGAAGGGIWEADDALASQLNWHVSTSGIPSNAIGSIIFDRSDPQGKTLYAGTGEPNGSSDSEAGVGLYKSIDFGQSWTLVPGSVAVSIGRSIAAIAVDPADPAHLLIGTAVARHGSSSVNGGRFTPPGSAPVGLYESHDGGATFATTFSVPSDTVSPTSANGGDFFRGGVSKIEYAPDGRVYVAVFDYGLYRGNGQGGYEQVFASAGLGATSASLGARTEFSLAPTRNGLRIYLGDTDGGPAAFYRVDDANVPASALTDGTANPGWTRLSNGTKGTPGFASYNFCSQQCSYDMFVASPPGRPEEVWIGGQMQYGEIFTQTPPSNGRTVQRSVDAGVSFTDMTNDTQSPPLGMHPDQHAIAFAGTPGVAFIGSDGGVIRTDGAFVDASLQCASRGLGGADLTDCQLWLKSVPRTLASLNAGLATLQFQSASVNALNPLNDIMGGTQDNGTWAFNSKSGATGSGNSSWFESIGGDGGQSGVDTANPNTRFHTYDDASPEVNFRGTDPLGWNWIADPLISSRESRSFYIPIAADPTTSGTIFAGLDSVWRTTDSGGNQAFLEQHCNEFFGDFTVTCGDWSALGKQPTSSTSYGQDKRAASFVAAVARTPADANTMWVGTRRGRLFITKNANDAKPANVQLTRIDTAAQPTRFISGIAIDPANVNHAVVSFSGYSAYTPTTPGHVFDVTYNPGTSTAVWKDLSYNLGDQPVTGIALDPATGDLFAATDFGIAMLRVAGTSWQPAAGSFPAVATYGITLDARARVLYAATHGRGIWKLDLSQ